VKAHFLPHLKKGWNGVIRLRKDLARPTLYNYIGLVGVLYATETTATACVIGYRNHVEITVCILYTMLLRCVNIGVLLHMERRLLIHEVALAAT
jgi:hypothetical protein